MESKPSKRKLKSASDILGDGQFFPDKPKVPFSECLGKEFVLIDAKIIKDFNGQFGKHDAGLMLLEPTGDMETEAVQFTTICSGLVVVERLQKLITNHALPCLVTPTYVNDTYYNLI